MLFLILSVPIQLILYHLEWKRRENIEEQVTNFLEDNPTFTTIKVEMKRMCVEKVYRDETNNCCKKDMVIFSISDKLFNDFSGYHYDENKFK